MTKKNRIIICRASELLEIVEKEKPQAVLSIEHPGATTGGAPRLSNGTLQKILCFWDSEQPVTDGPDIDQVTQGIFFVLEHLDKGDVVVHCHAGKSRSTAVVLGALALRHPEKGAEELITFLLEIRPGAAPNIIIVEMVDGLSNRKGELLAAVQKHPDISTARQEAEIGRQYWIRKDPTAYKKMNPEKFPPPK